MPASPKRTCSSAWWRSGSDNNPLIATQDEIPCLRSPSTWSAMSATSGEITTVSAPVFSYFESAGSW